MVFIFYSIFFAAVVFPLWAGWRHFEKMDNDPGYRRRARERGF